jgi:hypothetical protein
MEQAVSIVEWQVWPPVRSQRKGSGTLAKKTIGFGIALILLGVVGYFGSGTSSITALIPAAFGVVLLVLGVLALNEARRKVVMHIAVVVGLLGFLGPIYSLATHSGAPRVGAMVAQLIMVVITGFFVGLCVKSFVDARRGPA